MTTLASDTVVLPLSPQREERAGVRREKDVKRGNPDPLWLRWNDYAIGLFLQGDLKGAAEAWTRVAELAPEKPDGPLNRARAEIAEGRLADAKASLAEAEKRRPGWGKTSFFRATVAKDEGRLDDAQKDLEAVLEKFPSRPGGLERPGARPLAGRPIPRGIRPTGKPWRSTPRTSTRTTT